MCYADGPYDTPVFTRLTVTLHTAPTSGAPDSPRTLGVILLARAALNLQYRIIYPFLPAISRGLGVSLETASLLISARALVGTTAPLYGFLTDRYGRLRVMLIGLAALVLGAALVAAAPPFALVMAAFILLGLSKASYDPAMQAHIGDAVPYARRGRVMGLLELSWSLSWLIGVPATGFLIGAAGWQSPFWIIAGLGVISFVATLRFWPKGLRQKSEPLAAHQVSVPGGQRFLWANRNALAALIVSMLLVMANENVFIVYGAWMEREFGLAVAALGVASIVISLAELVAEGASAGLADHLGKRRAVLTGLLLNVMACLLLPRLAGSLVTALAGVALMFLMFEFSIVSLLPLISELAPDARGTLLALFAAATAGGRMIGSLMGPRLWEAGGLSLNAAVSAGGALLAALILWWGVREG